MAHIPRSASGKLARLKDKDAIEAEKARIEEKKAKAASIVFRHVVERKDLATAYSEVFPESTATRKQAKRQAGRLIKWFRLNFPIAIRQLLYLKGYDDDRIIDLIGEQLQATTLVKKRTRKFKRTNDAGTDEWVEQHEFIEVPDHKARADAIQKLIILSGHHARRALKPSEDEARASEPRDVTGSGEVNIRTRRKLSDEEWQRKYQATIDESNASQRADQMIRDIERRVAEAETAAGEVTHGPPANGRYPPSAAGRPPP